ncbi:MAG: hypothetical protein M3O09_18365 [Acidobacteriota bacterium]|nr:hypothetical protein [Acidobacteriota bacterium]
MLGAYSLPWTVWLVLIVSFWALQLMVCAFSEIREIISPDRRNRAIYTMARATLIFALGLSLTSIAVRSVNWASHRTPSSVTATAR